MPAWRRCLTPLLAILILAGGAVPRLAALPFVSADMRTFLLPWYDIILAHGGWRALGESFSNYTPAYLYLLTAATYWRWAPPVVSIKLISIVFDYALAGLMGLLARRQLGPGPRSLLGPALVLFAPTVILNGALWGQADSIYTAFLLACVWFALQKRPFWASLSFSVALAFKLQAIFLAPFCLVLCTRQELRWAPTALLPPLTYVLFALPAALLGQPLDGLLKIYLYQMNQYGELSVFAPNLYAFCAVGPQLCQQPVLTAAAVIAAGLGVLLLVRIFTRSRRPMEPAALVLLALLSAALMPFLLPRMHERYFYPADILSLALVLYRPRWWWVAAAFQVSSLLAYSGPLLQAYTTGAMLGGLINLGVIAFLLVLAPRAVLSAPTAAKPVLTPA